MGLIRIALIGLSASAKTSWAEQGHLTYLLSSRGRAHYEIVALLNSSEKSARASIEHFKLPSTVKAYGNPADVAADPSVDLVVCNTRVDLHFSTVEPSLRAGKAIFVEWPLAENYERALALTETGNCSHSIIGLQSRVSPPVQKVQEILASGKIGSVLSSDIKAFGSYLPRDRLGEGLAYFTNREVGGNPVTIAFSHMIDYVHDTLGEFASFQSRLQIQRPEVAIVDNDGQVTRKAQTNVPDFIAVHGPLARGKADIVNGATLAVTYRTGPSFKDKPAFVWSINGEKGEILLTSPEGPSLGSDSYGQQIQIEVHDFASDTVTNIAWDWKDWQKDIGIRGRCTAEVYERYASWSENGRPKDVPKESRWPTLQDSIIRHKELKEIFAQYDAQDR